MANTAHLVRRQSSRDLAPQRSLDRLELKEMRGRLVALENGTPSSYGATNSAFDDSSPNTKAALKCAEKVERAPFKPEGGEDDRESWDSKLTFLLATIGYAVGLGNVWRFPYLAQKNGGGAFLVPYFIMLAIEGIPMFYLELAIGQRLRKGAIGVWNQVSPFLAGIGISSAVVSFNVALYYNTIIAWCLFYFAQSFQAELPWSECPKKYFPNGSYAEEPECTVSTPTQYFWYRTTLMASVDINSPTPFNWRIAIALVIAWILVYMCMIKGIASSGKVVYVTATFPYIVLIIFFFRGVTLPGMSNGLKHLFTPKVHILFCDNNISWKLSFGGFKATLNYERCLEEKNNGLPTHHLGHLVTTLENATKSVINCDLQQELENCEAGTGLAFIIFTEAINQFPGAQFWSVLFFLMLFTLGIDSQFGTLEGVITSIVDMKLFPNLRKEILTGVMCLVCCLISMCFAHGAGSYIFVLFDNFSGNFPLLVIALFECIGVAYVYGLKRFADDIELMTGSRPGLYWLICWKYLSPLAMSLILAASIADLFMYGSTYPAWAADLGETVPHEWPLWAILLACLLVTVAVIWIPLVAICRLFSVVIIDDNEKAWFPSGDLKEFHGIVEHEVTTAETLLFCIRPDGSEGFCCPTSPPDED
ncbi:sodium-dependent neutral amino acid transporter B(0)AT3 [Halyomorpha halys]|uniref:sodium-dependent neutral amino acid transporter B(0)AT3 n=1 Tax=Halyomorpha halys TaxID=286706 RepID=UPI0034D21859